MPILLIAIILGIVEGVTEFLPVSSTGHLILATELLGFDAEKWAAFNVIIQLGAILAIVVLYWRTFWAVLEGMLKGNAVSWRFVRNVLVAFLPSAILGFLLINKIEALLGSPYVVAVALILGGIARKKLNSAAVRRSTPRLRPPMIVAPERLTPGIIARHWTMPTPITVLSGISATPTTSARLTIFSISRIAIPPRMSATATT